MLYKISLTKNGESLNHSSHNAWTSVMCKLLQTSVSSRINPAYSMITVDNKDKDKHDTHFHIHKVLPSTKKGVIGI